MSGRADHELALALLRACKIPADRVTKVSAHFEVEQLSTIDVTYRVINADTQELADTVVRYVPEGGAA